MDKKVVAVGCDHGAYYMKEAVKAHLSGLGYEVLDLGTDSAESVNYPEYASAVCNAIRGKKAALGILMCGTGIGMSIAANKHRGIRAALCSDTFSARFTRMHNDANVLCMGARVIGEGLALDIVDSFISAEYEGGRHGARLDMIAEIEKSEAAIK